MQSAKAGIDKKLFGCGGKVVFENLGKEGVFKERWKLSLNLNRAFLEKQLYSTN